MRRDVSLFIAASMTALWHASLAHAFVEPATGAQKSAVTRDRGDDTVIGIRVVRPGLVLDTHGFAAFKGKTGAKIKADKASGAARVISGAALASTHLKSAKAADYVALATKFVAEHKDLLGVDPQDLVLNKGALLVGKDLQLVKFGVKRDGLVVQDANIDFRFKFGKLVQVVNESFAEAAVDTRAGKGGLERSVEKYLNADSVTPDGELYRVRATKKGYELVRVARFTAVTPVDTYAVEVEAANGHIFEVRARKLMLDGSVSGQIHPRYYAEPLVIEPFPFATLSYTGGTVTADTDGNYVNAPDASRPGIDGLYGPRVKIVPQGGDKLTATGVVARDRWDVIFQKTGTAPANNDLVVAQAMTYYHVNKEIKRVQQYIDNPWFSQQLTANVNLDQTCNAYWDGESINLFQAGDGCANTALISDVFYHEWGHGLDANTGGIDDGAYSEGFGDIMSLMMTRSPVLGPGFKDDGSAVRNLEADKVYPADQGEVHAEGLIIGSTFYDLFQALTAQYGEDKADDMLGNYAVKSVVAATRYTDVYDALLVIDDDDGDLTNGTPNFCILNKTFAQHGLATADEGCNLARLDTFEIDDKATFGGGNGNGILEPGETAKIWVTARNAANSDLASLDGILSVTGSDGVEVVDHSLVWGAVAAHSAQRSEQSAKVSVGNDVACGTTVHAKVKLTSGERSAVAEQDLLIGKLDGANQDFVLAGLPQPIHDNATTTATVDVAGAQWAADTAVYSAHLKFDITHTYVGDLTVRVIAPDGTSKDVWKGSGSGADAHVDQDVTALLSGLKGKGTWKVTVSDGADEDEGTLDAVTLSVTPAHFVCH